MDNLSENIKKLCLNEKKLNEISYEYVNVFKNPNKLPINQIHLDKITLELKDNTYTKSGDLDSSDEAAVKHFEKKNQILPALDKSWLPESLPIFNYTQYSLISSFKSNENQSFKQNLFYLETLNYLLQCNYHQFWCSVLFEPEIIASLHSFILNPLLEHEIVQLQDNYHVFIYESVFHKYLLVYNRLLTFKESESEYMSNELGMKYLFKKKLLNLPIVISLIILYEKTNLLFINRLINLYFCDMSQFQIKEVEEFINQVLITLEMIGGHICGFDKNAIIIPIAIDERPKTFNLNWIYSVVNYLLNTISSLHVLLKFYKPSIEMALNKNIPYRLSFTYERVYFNLYELLENRKELTENPKLADLIFETIALGRFEFIEVYHTFVTNCLAKTLEFQGNTIRQEEYIEIYLKLMTSALDDEYFICDYHEICDVEAQNDMFTSCGSLDTTRTDYIMTCMNNFARHNRLLKMKLLNNGKKEEEKRKDFKENGFVANEQSTITKPNDKEIDDLIKIVVDMFPHLGDGFVLKCLEAYNYQPNDVISAILEENLPPHIIDIPFDLIRIPPEPEEEKPILAYRGKKPSYDDALKLLNDKKDMKTIKTFILDGIQYTNEYEGYDDEYDDRLDEETVNVPDYGSEDILKYNPNYDDEVVSDTSYSENEYDEKGEIVPVVNDKSKLPFCEDPALVRARRESKYQNQGTSKRNVIGKAKGQGQDKNVLQNRQKKNVNKSSRANHNRKSGAQWKRNKGMLPS